jgi:hypothetical protein
MVPFLTALELSHKKTTLEPYVAPVNHNKVNESNTLQIIHTLIGNFCHGDKNKESQPEDMGNDARIIFACHAKVNHIYLQHNILNLKSVYHNLTNICFHFLLHGPEGRPNNLPQPAWRLAELSFSQI